MSNCTPLNQLSISIACLLDEPNTITVTDIEHIQDLTTKVENFVEEVFELAFGDNAINRDFSFQEVLTKLKEEGEELHHYQENTIVLYDRCQLDDWKSQFTDEPVTNEEWRNFQNHRDVDYALEVATDYLNGAESSVIDEDKYTESEVQQ